MSIVVQKYGGTSVGSTERIQNVADRIIETKENGSECVVVVSAMGKSTDSLVEMAGDIAPDPSKREMDMLLSTGEQVTIALLTMALQRKGHDAISLTGWQAGIQTESVHGEARIDHIETQRIQKAVQSGKVVIVAGFQGVTEDGSITTLGRGGSDTTAVALAGALDADRCEIYTDVTGVYTADPRLVPSAQKLDAISYDEMLELATLGAGVLHPRAVECAKNRKVKLNVCSSFVKEKGTVVEEHPDVKEPMMVSGVAHDAHVAKVTVSGLPSQVDTLSKLFYTLASANINVDIIIQNSYVTETTEISFSVSGDDLPGTLNVLEDHRSTLNFSEISYDENLSKVSIVGAGMVHNPGVAAEMFRQLGNADIPTKLVSTSEINVSCVIPSSEIETAVRSLHSAFGLDVQEREPVHA